MINLAHAIEGVLDVGLTFEFATFLYNPNHYRGQKRILTEWIKAAMKKYQAITLPGHIRRRKAFIETDLPQTPDEDDLQVTVSVHLGNLNVSKSADPDEIHPDTVKPPTNLFAGPMCKLFSGDCPHVWLTLGIKELRTNEHYKRPLQTRTDFWGTRVCIRPG